MTKRQTPRITFQAALFTAAVALSIPAVFAQADKAAMNEPAKNASESTATTQAAQSAAPKKTWADLDTDKSGSLSKTEASAIPSLQAVFDQADANADGALTGEEYKAYLAASGRDQSGAPAKATEEK